MGPVEPVPHLLGSDVRGVREDSSGERSRDGETQLDARLPQREAAERQVTGAGCSGLGGRAILVELVGGHAGRVERHDAVRADLALGVATIGARTTGEKATQRHDLRIADPVGARCGAGRPRHRDGLDGVAVVGGKEEARVDPRCERELASEGDVAAHVGADLGVAHVATDAGDLNAAADADPLVGAEPLVGELEVGRQLRVGREDGNEIRVEHAHVGERRVLLHRVGETGAEVSERALEPRAAAELAIAEHGCIRGEITAQKQRVDAALRPEHARRARLHETRLAELRAQSPLGEQPARWLERGQPRGVEHDAGCGLDQEVPEPAQEVAIFPASHEVDVRFEAVELDAAAEPYASELRNLDFDPDRNHRRFVRIGREILLDRHRAEDTEVEDRLSRRFETLDRVRLARLQIERARHRSLGDLAEPLDANGAKVRKLSRLDPVAHAGDVLGQIHVGAAAHAGKRVAVHAQEMRELFLEAVHALLLEGFSEPHPPSGEPERLLADLRR